MSRITTHILDVASGKPAAGVPVVLEYKTQTSGWQPVGQGVTNSDGRIVTLLSPDEALIPGHYRLLFDTSSYYPTGGVECFFPQVTISFVVNDAEQHYHVPLLLSPYGYTTYRGS